MIKKEREGENYGTAVLEFASSRECIWGEFSPRLLSLPSLRWLNLALLCLLVNYFPMWLTFVEGGPGNDPVLMMTAVCACTEQQWKA